MQVQIPVVDDLFVWSDEAASLIVGQCVQCGARYFPLVSNCRNPECRSRLIERTQLTGTGRLYSFTLQTYQPPAPFKMDQWSPYLIGVVEFEGLRVMGMVAGCSMNDLRIGMQMQITADALRRDAQGQEVLTYKFRPATGQAGQA